MSWRKHLRPSLAELDIYDVPPATAPARMHANECPEPWPAHVREALAQVVREVELERYPDTSGRRLRALLAERHGCTPERVVLGNGSDEVISILLTALSGRPDAAVVTPEPTFVMYAHSARVLGMPVRTVALDAHMHLDVAGMRAALPGAAVCFLARPNNPTSTLWHADAIAELVAEFPETIFVIDEAYGAYAPGTSLWRPDAPDNQVHMATLSKVGMAALRVGYGIAHPDLAEAMNKVRHPYNLSATSLALAHCVLERFGDEQRAMLQRTIDHRARLESILASIEGAELFDAHANLVLARVGECASALVRALGERGILIKDVSKVPGLAGCIRASVGTSEDLDRLEAELPGAWAAAQG